MYKYYLTYKDTKTEIEKEPIGFDAFETTVERNVKSHGMSVEYSENDLKFYDDISIAILKEAYSDDINNIVLFSVEYNGDEQYRGSIDFTNYSECFDNYHYILTKIADIGIESIFFNRQEQKVDLDSLIAFDGAALPEYPALKRNITLPAMAWLVRNVATVTDATLETIHDSEHGEYFKGYKLPTGSVTLSEIDSFDSLESGLMYIGNWSGGGAQDFNQSDAVFIFDAAEYLANPTIFKIRVRYFAQVTTRGQQSVFYIAHTHSNGGLKRILRNDFHSDSNYNIYVDDTHEVEMEVGDMITISFWHWIWDENHFSIEVYPGTGIEISANETITGKDTTANVSMVHEALSRIVEATTNGQITVKSDYYGRSDSNVHPTTGKAGSSATKAIIPGLRIRNASEQLFALSFSDIFKGLQPIDNIGYGFVWEDGIRRLRIEPYEWFYSDNTVILEVNRPNSKKTSLETDNVFASLKIGYKKYETEGTNGLDAFLTEREYRTRQTITSVKMEQVSEFIADGYAIEQTRRQESTSKDWRYDNDTFIIQLKEINDEYSVEQGAYLSQGIISRDTVYNVRISPARCAKKWLNRLFGWSNKQEELIFTSGTGNISASTSMGPSEIPLIDENGNFPSDTQKRVLRSEITEFEYPITIEQYNTIVRNPYGIIKLDGDSYYIRKMTFNWKSRLASFEVVPKYIIFT